MSELLMWDLLIQSNEQMDEVLREYKALCWALVALIQDAHPEWTYSEAHAEARRLYQIQKKKAEELMKEMA